MNRIPALLFALFIANAQAITPVGTPSQGGAAGQDSPLTFAHDSGSTGERRITILDVFFFDDLDSITGVTYGGQAMAACDTMGSAVAGGITRYVLVDPPTGSNNVSITMDGNFAELFAIAYSAADVNQATPCGDSDDATNTGTSISGTLTLANGNNWGLGAYYGYSGGTATITPSDTEILETELTAETSGRASQRGDGSLSWTISASADNLALFTELVHDDDGGPNIPAIMHHYRQMKSWMSGPSGGDLAALVTGP